MTEREAFLKRVEHEFPTTMKVLKAIPADQGDFKPHERSQTAKQVVQTMIAENIAVMRMLNGEEDIFKMTDFPTLAEAVAAYEKTYSESIAKMKSSTEEDYEKPTAGMFAAMFPRRMDVAWMLINDSIHHRGQLSVYIRLSGGKVPSIYGPSADDNPFAQVN